MRSIFRDAGNVDFRMADVQELDLEGRAVVTDVERIESAVYERNEERRRRLLTFTIVGGGPTGIEFAGALAELIHGPLLADYPMLTRDDVRVLLVEAMDRVLLGMPEELADYAVERLRSRHVEVRTGAMASRVTDHAIHFEEGEPLPTDTVVWTAGVKGPDSLEAWGRTTPSPRSLPWPCSRASTPRPPSCA